MDGFAPVWRTREPPLPVVGVLAHDRAAARLARRLAGEEALRDLDAYLDSRTIVVLGQSDDLPWVDGAIWLGEDGAGLYPTTAQAQFSSALIVAAARRAAGVDGTVVATPDHTFVLRTNSGVVDPAVLLAFAEKVDAP